LIPAFVGSIPTSPAMLETRDQNLETNRGALVVRRLFLLSDPGAHT
jgi:hypothetical protein